jgi:hypothetical protein
MHKSLQYAQFVVIAITCLMVMYLTFSLFMMQKALYDFGQGMEQVGTEVTEEMTKVQNCIDAAGDDFDAQLKCYG